MPFYLIDKQKGKTSNQVSTELKSKLKIKKAGFSGVLDPFATGLLIFATEEETKFLDIFLNMNKTYVGKILFGKTTDTLDIDGNVIKEEKVNVSIDELKKIIKTKFLGEIEQIPPIYSNIKVNGKRSHELARLGININHKPVKRNIFEFEIFEFKNNEFKFKIVVSSGTYIRSIARDLGNEINSPAMLTELRRIKIGNIFIDENNEISKIDRNKILQLDELLISDILFKKILEGKIINIDSIEDKLIVINSIGNEILIEKVLENNYKIKRRIR